VRYADDFVVLVAGTRAHADTLRDEVAAVLRPMGLRLSEEKTTIAHIDEGFDFLGFRIQRRRQRGTRTSGSGERAGETDAPKEPHRAPARSSPHPFRGAA
jgi:Reverse transcriptase (RNA-dependent DNA polymerase)